MRSIYCIVFFLLLGLVSVSSLEHIDPEHIEHEEYGPEEHGYEEHDDEGEYEEHEREHEEHEDHEHGDEHGHEHEEHGDEGEYEEHEHEHQEHEEHEDGDEHGHEHEEHGHEHEEHEKHGHEEYEEHGHEDEDEHGHEHEHEEHIHEIEHTEHEHEEHEEHEDEDEHGHEHEEHENGMEHEHEEHEEDEHEHDEHEEEGHEEHDQDEHLDPEHEHDDQEHEDKELELEQHELLEEEHLEHIDLEHEGVEEDDDSSVSETCDENCEYPFFEETTPAPPPHLIIYPRIPPYTIYCDSIAERKIKDPVRIRFPFAKKDQYYILVMLDPDLIPAPFVHWIVANIPGRLLLSRRGVYVNRDDFIILEYVPPNPPNEQHRYQFMLYEQEEPISYDLGTRFWKRINRSPFSEYVFIDDLDDESIVNKTMPVGYFQYNAYMDEDSKCVHGKEYDWDKCRPCKEVKMEYSNFHNCTEFVQNVVQSISYATDMHFPNVFIRGPIPPYVKAYKHALRRAIRSTLSRELCRMDWYMMGEYAYGGTYKCMKVLVRTLQEAEQKASGKVKYVKQHNGKKKFKFGKQNATKEAEFSSFEKLFAKARFVRPLCKWLCRRIGKYFQDHLDYYRRHELGY